MLLLVAEEAVALAWLWAAERAGQLRAGVLDLHADRWTQAGSKWGRADCLLLWDWVGGSVMTPSPSALHLMRPVCGT